MCGSPTDPTQPSKVDLLFRNEVLIGGTVCDPSTDPTQPSKVSLLFIFEVMMEWRSMTPPQTLTLLLKV